MITKNDKPNAIKLGIKGRGQNIRVQGRTRRKS